MWFLPGKSKLNVRVATTKYHDEGINESNTALPLHSTTRVRVEAVGRQLLLFLNDTLDSYAYVSSARKFGSATLYTSNPWESSAMAVIGNVKMNPIFKFSIDIKSNLVPGLVALKKTTVPQNYSLSFNITPTAIYPAFSNILHYTQDGTTLWGPGGRIPGTFLYFT